MTKEIGLVESVENVEQILHSTLETNDSEKVTILLWKVLKILEAVPLSITERNKIEYLANKCLTTHNIDKKQPVYKGFVERLSFTFIPGISHLSGIQG